MPFQKGNRLDVGEGSHGQLLNVSGSEFKSEFSQSQSSIPDFFWAGSEVFQFDQSPPLSENQKNTHYTLFIKASCPAILKIVKGNSNLIQVFPASAIEFLSTGLSYYWLTAQEYIAMLNPTRPPVHQVLRGFSEISCPTRSGATSNSFAKIAPAFSCRLVLLEMSCRRVWLTSKPVEKSLPSAVHNALRDGAPPASIAWVSQHASMRYACAGITRIKENQATDSWLQWVQAPRSL